MATDHLLRNSVRHTLHGVLFVGRLGKDCGAWKNTTWICSHWCLLDWLFVHARLIVSSFCNLLRY